MSVWMVGKVDAPPNENRIVPKANKDKKKLKLKFSNVCTSHVVRVVSIICSRDTFHFISIGSSLGADVSYFLCLGDADFSQAIFPLFRDGPLENGGGGGGFLACQIVFFFGPFPVQ